MTAHPPPSLDAGDRRVAIANAEAAAALVAGLIAGGVRHAVVSPGSRNTPLVLAFAAAGIELRAVLDERVAGFYALGLARGSGRPVALACTSGSAGTHYLPALAEAHTSRVPLVVLTADRPPELHGCGAPQTLDQTRLFGAFVKRSRTLPPPVDVSGARRRALVHAADDAARLARSCPAGPVHLDAQFREPLWMPGVDAAPAIPVVEDHPPALRLPPPGALADVDAPRAVIVCGPDAAPDAATAEAIARLGRTRGWPVLAEAASGVRFSSDGPDSPIVSTYDALLRGPLATLAPDRVLRFGRASTSKPLTRWLAAHAVGRMTAVDPAGERHDPDHLARVVEADALAVAEALCDPGAARAPQWLARWRSADRAAAGHLRAACAEGWWSGAIVARLMAALPEGAALHAANSMPIRDIDGFALPGASRPTVFTSRGTNGIDGTFATALGEARARGSAPLALLVGDLATLHDAGGLLFGGALLDGRWTAPVVAVVVDNGGGGIFEYLPVAAHPDQFERLFLTPQPARLDALCAAAGVGYRAVGDGSALDAALLDGFAAPGITVVHARVDRADDVARHRRVWDAVARLSLDRGAAR